jgi:HEPN domain-containing protein
MINEDMAIAYLDHATWYLEKAQEACSRRKYSIAIRHAQESLELATKGILRLFTIEYPRSPDISDAIDIILDKLTPEYADILKTAKPLIKELVDKRGPAFYGNEREGVPPHKLFNSTYADTTVKRVQVIVSACEEILRKFLNKQVYGEKVNEERREPT